MQHTGGNAVTFVNRGVRVNALVVQSTLVNILDSTQETGIRQEEHLTLVYLQPQLLQSLMSGADIDRAVTKAFGVLAVTEAPDDPKNLLSYALVGATDEHTIHDPNVVVPVQFNPHPELVQYPPAHNVQVPAIRDRSVSGKIPAETSYRETNPAGEFVPTREEWVAEGHPAELYDEVYPKDEHLNLPDELAEQAK